MTDPARTAAGTILAVKDAKSIHAGNISQSLVSGSKTANVHFKQQINGASTLETTVDNGEQGQIVQDSAHSLSITGEGGIPVTTSAGQLVFTRNGQSEGLNNQNKFVLGSVKDASALTVQAWRVNDGQIVQSDGTTAIQNLNDTSQLTDVDLSDYLTFSEASTKMTLNNILDSRTVENGTVSQQVTVYDSVGGSHTVDITWKKTAAGTGNYNDATAGCDVWNLAVTYDGGTQAKMDTNGGNDYTAANSQDIYIKNGSLVGVTANGANTTLEDAADVYLPFANVPYNPLTLDIGISNTAANNFSTIKEAATTSSLNATSNGSPLVQMNDWQVNEKGQVEVFYPTSSRVVYQIPIATVPSLSGVKSKDGYWVNTESSGSILLNKAGEGGAGTYNPATIEQSTNDPTRELVKQLPLQTVEAAAAKLIQGEKESRDRIMGAF